MDISLGESRIYALEPRFSFEDIRRRAEDKRFSALGSGIGGLLQRPKAEDVGLVRSQRRFEPLWHVACTARYVYDRTRRYQVPTTAGDVRSVTVLGTDFPILPYGKGESAFALDVLEHCSEEIRDELFIDGTSGAPVATGQTIIAGARTELTDPNALAEDETVVVAPEQRASAIVRQLLAKLLKPLQADAVFEESLAVEALELYYRPIWAFEFHLKSKDKHGVVEVDALSGETRITGSLQVGQLTRMVSREALFDIGADTIGLIVPGGSIAVKLARVAVDKSY